MALMLYVIRNGAYIEYSENNSATLLYRILVVFILILEPIVILRKNEFALLVWNGFDYIWSTLS